MMRQFIPFLWDRSCAHQGRHFNKQSGVVLIVALIVLVVMTLASIAMVRSVDTSTIIAGNLAFRQSATASGDAGVEAALTWLTTNAASLEQDNAANGYYATSQNCLDITGNGNVPPPSKCPPPIAVLDWNDAHAVKTLPKDAADNTMSYVIHRMCDSAGQLDGSTCATEQTAQTGSSQGAARQMTTYQPGAWESVANRGYYRITVRVSGPRNTHSYVQTIVSL
ncbi:hypothetical protein ACFQUU_02690 [Herbaspirillum sp. GCM10030257]|uniref:pilus assembly PilX family protein n=1 Tax=Herbaspirillum sp. GCM10030257 TaxID=3273393 RepID=UPI00361B74ED